MRMRKISLCIGTILLMLVPLAIQADDCLFIDEVLPGQVAPRTEHHIQATIAVGDFTMRSLPGIYELQSTDENVVLTYNYNGTDKEDPADLRMLALRPGQATVSYNEYVNDCKSEHSVAYTVVKGTPHACFEIGVQEYEVLDYDLGDHFYQPKAAMYIRTLRMKDGIPSFQRIAITDNLTYHSSDPTVATIDETGHVTIIGGGSTILTASWPGNDEWNAAVAQLVLNVDPNPMYLKVAGTKVTTANHTDILGDGSAEYDPDTQTLTLHNVTWDFSDHWIDAKYGVVEFWGDGEFYIVIDGNCTFTNTTMGINTAGHNDGIYNHGSIDVIITGINNGTLCCSGDDIQIAVDGWLGIVSMTAFISCRSERGVAVETDGLSVDNFCKVVIAATGEEGVAAKVQYLYLDEFEYLEGAHHVDYYGFYTDEDNEHEASVVAILPAMLFNYGRTGIPSNTEETTIDFAKASETEPQEEHAVVNLGANDTYNTDEQRLEISSTWTGEEVDAALQMFGPGSDALKYALPGSIGFYLPAGIGTMTINCQTNDGYALQTKVGNQPSDTIQQSTMDWHEQNYDVEEDTYVVVYSTRTIPASAFAPAFRQQTNSETPDVAAYIKAIKIIPGSKLPTNDASSNMLPTTTLRKLLRNGNLVIERNGQSYNAQGIRVR